MRPRAPPSTWVFPASLAHDACATRALVFGEQRVPAAQVHAAFLAALNGLYAKVQSAAAIAAEFAPSGAV